MFFVLSKVLLFLLMPFWWIVILFIWMKLSKTPKTKKRLFAGIVVVFIVFTNPFIYRSVISAWQPDPVVLPAANHVYGAGIVLGGMAGFDKNEKGYFGNNADRFIQIANLYHQGIIQKIVVTGGTGKLQQDEPAETSFLKPQLIANGVKEADIIIESRSRNTYENAVYTKKILDSLQIKPPYILVTSALHMHRSASVFTKAGYNFIAMPCDYKVIPAAFSIEGSLVPNVALLNDWAWFLKEWIGLGAYKLTGKA